MSDLLPLDEPATPVLLEGVAPPPPPDPLDALIAAQPAGHSLFRGLYNDEAAFARDMERIFGRHWVLAGHESRAKEPGQWFTVEMGGESVIIVRGRDGALRAFANVCRHRGSRICLNEQGKSATLTCPYHAWVYNLDGSIRSARHMGEGFEKARYGLKPVALETAAGLVFVSLADKPLDFSVAKAAIDAAFGAYGWGDAKVARREVYRVEANWKLAVENYLECYHCGPSHPEYSKLHALEQPLHQIAAMNAEMIGRTAAMGVNVPEIDARVGSETGQAPVFVFRYALYDGVKSGGPDGEPVAPLMGDFSDYDGGVTSCHFAPSSFFIAYPDHGVLYRFIPVDAKSSAMELVWLVRGDAEEGRDYNLERLTWLWRVTTEADKRITEDNQKGVNSRFYEPGPYAPVEPNAINWVAWYLAEIARA
ncbi:MAG: aromatic ring-hydroxylating dioxygenase subunit alpha [Rhodobacteraceae bacterium]|nr:MAG: aromatic ring-hydroxylating dioxygenase subunit alpha [Paracoccaceae bacterium]